MPQNSRASAADHLKGHRFQPGESGNLKGRPLGVGDGIVAHLRRALSKDENASAKAIVAEMIKQAEAGKTKMLDLVLQYTESRPKQTHELTGPDGGPIQLQSTGARKRLEGRLGRLGQEPGPDPPSAGGDDG